MKHATSTGCCEKDIGASKAHIPQTCEHGEIFLYTKAFGSKPRKPMRRRSSPLKRTRRRETAAEKRARLHFNEVVKSWPCWFSWHRPCERCEGGGEIAVPLRSGGVEYGPQFIDCPVCNGDGKHHCTHPKDSHHLVPKDFIRQRFRTLPEPELLSILFNPLIGAPICRKAHEAVESGNDKIYWQDLTEECLEYVGSLPESVLVRLEIECPKRSPEQFEAVAG
jgi:hypothetical protein